MENVEAHFKEILKTRKIHLTLIDPDEQSPEEAVKIAQEAIAGGSDGIMVGGSTVDTAALDGTCKALSENIDLPIVLFPGNINGASKYADAIFFMSYLNSNNPYWIIGAQALAAPAVNKTGIEKIPMGYVVAEPGGTVGWVGDAKLIPRNKPKIPAIYAMAAENLGMRFFYIEAGSGADQPIPPEMVAYTKRATQDIVLVVGGGIRDGVAAYTAAKAGADIVVTGTVVEETSDVKGKIMEIVAGVRKASE